MPIAAQWHPSYTQGFARNAAEAAYPGLRAESALLAHPPLGFMNTVVRDESGRHNHGTYNGAWAVDPAMGPVLSMNGTSHYADFGNAPSLLERDTLTVLLWWKGTSYTSLDTYASRWDTGADKRSWLIYQSTQPAIQLTADGTSAVRKIYNFSAADKAIIIDGSWHQFGFTWDLGTLTLYIDGQEALGVTKSEDDAFTQLFASTIPVLLGASQANGIKERWLPDQYGPVTVHNRVLFPGEIQQMHVDPSAIVRPKRRTLPPGIVRSP